MNKPTVFFSHSSRDQIPLGKLKAAFLKLTGGSVDVFLSSDGQSIPLGRNWVHKVEEALESANLMVVFVTPTSLKSSWLYFESGFAYSKGLRVVPVGFLGADLTALPPPLSLLQGFNITSEAGLNNIIAITNDVFKHSHQEAFSEGDYKEICSGGANGATDIFGVYGALVDQVKFLLQVGRDFEGEPIPLLDRLYQLFQSMSLDCQCHENRLDLPGVSFVAHETEGSREIYVNVEGSAAGVALPLVEKAFQTICIDGTKGRLLRIEFTDEVGFPSAYHQRSGRLIGTPVRLAPNERLQFQDLQFTIDRLRYFRSTGVNVGCAYLAATIDKNEIPLQQIRELLALLFEHRVLLIDSE